MGRHRQFDVDTALEAALAVFWRKGFEGASYTDLTKATKVERPGLYAAFGNKEALFLRVLDRYFDRYWAYVPAALEQSASRDVAAELLQGAVELTTRHPDHLGCLGINAALAVSDDAESIRVALVEARASGEKSLRERLERAQTEGDLNESADPGVLAAYLMAVVHGISVQAKAGFPRELLVSVAEQAIATWPSPATSSVAA
jgi:AcrR family transcriptional regulator